MVFLKSKIRYLKKAFRHRKVKHHTIEVALHEYQAIYFSIPKVASTTWLNVCADLLDLDPPPDGRCYRIIDFPRINKKEVAKYENYFKFCFVRNPWARLVSCYGNKIKRGKGMEPSFAKFGVFNAEMSFEEFVRAVVDIKDSDADNHFKSQYTFITNECGKTFVDFIGKLENSDKDFSYVLEKLNRNDILIPHIRKNHYIKKKYKSYYTKELRDMVGKRYSKDIKLFEYDY